MPAYGVCMNSVLVEKRPHELQAPASRKSYDDTRVLTLVTKPNPIYSGRVYPSTLPSKSPSMPVMFIGVPKGWL